jgi:hypothetical protein
LAFHKSGYRNLFKNQVGLDSLEPWFEQLVLLSSLLIVFWLYLLIQFQEGIIQYPHYLFQQKVERNKE